MAQLRRARGRPQGHEHLAPCDRRPGGRHLGQAGTPGSDLSPRTSRYEPRLTSFIARTVPLPQRPIRPARDPRVFRGRLRPGLCRLLDGHYAPKGGRASSPPRGRATSRGCRGEQAANGALPGHGTKGRSLGALTAFADATLAHLIVVPRAPQPALRCLAERRGRLGVAREDPTLDRRPRKGRRARPARRPGDSRRDDREPGCSPVDHPLCRSPRADCRRSARVSRL